MLPSAQQCLGAFAAQLRRHTALTDADADMIHSLPARITIAEAHQDYRATTSIWIVAQALLGGLLNRWMAAVRSLACIALVMCLASAQS